MVANAFDDLAVSVHLSQLALRLIDIPSVYQQVVDHETDTGPNTEAVFRQYWSEHKNPFTIREVFDYMYDELDMQANPFFRKENFSLRPEKETGRTGRPASTALLPAEAIRVP